MSKVNVNKLLLQQGIEQMRNALILIELSGVGEVESGHTMCCAHYFNEETMGYGDALQDLILGLREINLEVVSEPFEVQEDN